jgi:hypothetical protein
VQFATVVIGVFDNLAHAAASTLKSWYQTKMAIEHASVVNSDALHVLVGPFLWLLAAAVLRRRLSDWLPWLFVLAAALFNEWVDLWVERWPSPRQQYAETVKDILLTVAVPTIFMLAARLYSSSDAAPAKRTHHFADRPPRDRRRVDQEQRQSGPTRFQPETQRSVAGQNLDSRQGEAIACRGDPPRRKPEGSAKPCLPRRGAASGVLLAMRISEEARAREAERRKLVRRAASLLGEFPV